MEAIEEVVIVDETTEVIEEVVAVVIEAVAAVLEISPLVIEVEIIVLHMVHLTILIVPKLKEIMIILFSLEIFHLIVLLKMSKLSLAKNLK